MLILEHIVAEINRILNVSEAILYSEKNDLPHHKEFALLLRDAGESWSTDLYNRIFEEYPLIKKNSINDKMSILFAELQSSSIRDRELKVIANDAGTLWRNYFLEFDTLEEVQQQDKKSLLRKISSLLDAVETD